MGWLKGIGVLAVACLPLSVKAAVLVDLHANVITESGDVQADVSCTANVCSLPPLAWGQPTVPMPVLPQVEAEVSVVNGELHGFARLLAGGQSFGRGEARLTIDAKMVVQGVVSNSLIGSVDINMGAPDLVVQGVGLARIMTEASANSDRVVSLCHQECGNASIVSSSTVTVRGARGEGATSFDDAVSWQGGDVFQPDTRVASEHLGSAQAPFAPQFALELSYHTELSVRYSHEGPVEAMDDFRHTLKFTGLHVFDETGADITKYLDIRLDNGLVLAGMAQPVPENAPWALLLAGLPVLGAAARRAPGEGRRRA